MLPQVPRANLLGLMAWGVLIALLAGSWKGADMRPLDLLRDSGNMVEYAASFFPPNFREWRYYLQEMVVTVQIALWGHRDRRGLRRTTGLVVFNQYRAGLGQATGAAPDGRGARNQ